MITSYSDLTNNLMSSTKTYLGIFMLMKVVLVLSDMMYLQEKKLTCHLRQRKF
jgi:hypothetical protein